MSVNKRTRIYVYLNNDLLEGTRVLFCRAISIPTDIETWNLQHPPAQDEKCRTFLFSNVAWRFRRSTSPSLIITVVFIVHNSAIFAFHSVNSSMMTNNFHEWIFFSFLIWFLKGVYSETLNWVFKWKKIQWKISLKNGKLSAIIWELNLFWMLIKSRTRMMNVLTSCM